MHLGGRKNSIERLGWFQRKISNLNASIAMERAHPMACKWISSRASIQLKLKKVVKIVCILFGDVRKG